MKKIKSFGIAMMTILLFILAGCQSKELTPQTVGTTFVNNFIYYKDSKNFKEYFVEGDLLEKQLRVKMNTFESHFSDVFDAIVDELSDKDKDKLSASLIEAVQNKAKYEVNVIDETDEFVKISYDIRGLDYAQVIENTLTNILDKPIVSEENNDKTAELQEAVMSSFLSALNKSDTKKVSVKVELTFLKDKRQWKLKDGQDKEINQLMLAFIAGVNDMETYEQETNKAVQNAVQKAEKKL
ncbi:DUF5105 domain-containing protein [Vagococcus silagei]|uniref:DUF5105 domain-containing protein n=1 Tax=Vagococcus silagei TaxID=2508885 RepID=A0A4S3B4Z2_9ENTE|nr:DUF5105 domain-containing protein [Vagococcus silagei]THB60900.1 DUF5105 domain-containing protein [Vagococcus silagei]